MSHQRRLRLRLSSTNSHVQSAEAHWRIRAKRIAGEQLCCAGKDGNAGQQNLGETVHESKLGLLGSPEARDLSVHPIHREFAASMREND
jgi:hypothetical protein